MKSISTPSPVDQAVMLAATPLDWLQQMIAVLDPSISTGDLPESEAIVHLREHILSVVTVVLRRLGRPCHALAEDITQEVLLILLKRDARRRYDPRKGSLKSWLHGVIRWSVIGMLRKNFRFQDIESFHDLQAKSASPAQATETRELMELIRAWLEELTPSRRFGITSKYLSGPADAEMPEATTVKVQRSRGMADLRERARQMR